MLLEQLWNRVDRTDTHFFGSTTSDGHAAINAKWAKSLALGKTSVHEHTCGRTIGQLAGITCCDNASLYDWLQTLETLQRRFRSVAFVALKRHRLIRHFLCLLLHNGHACRDRYNFIVE